MIPAAILLATLAAGDVPLEVRNDLKGGATDTRRAAARKAADLGGADAVPLLLPVAANDKDGGVRDVAFTELTRLKTAEAIEKMLAHGVKSRDAKVRAIAAEVLSVIEPPGIEESIVPLLDDKDLAVRVAAATCAGSIRAASARERLVRFVDSEKDPLLRSVAIESVSRIGGEGTTELLETWVQSPNEYVRLTALRQFFWNDKAKGAALTAIVLADPEVRQDGPLRPLLVQAIEEAVRYRAKDCLPRLVELLEHPRARARDMAYQALREITALDIPNVPKDWQEWWAHFGDGFVVPEKGGARQDPAGRSGVNFYGIPIVSDRLVFVIDFSGSMRESEPGGVAKIDAARDALAEVLTGLPEGARFSVIAFADEPRAWKPTLYPRNRANVESAIAFIRGMSATGATNIYDSLFTAMTIAEADTVVLLSDGAPSAGTFQFFSRIRHHVRLLNRLRKIAVSSVALKTSDDAKRFLRELAKESGGEFVER